PTDYVARGFLKTLEGHAHCRREIGEIRQLVQGGLVFPNIAGILQAVVNPLLAQGRRHTIERIRMRYSPGPTISHDPPPISRFPCRGFREAPAAWFSPCSFPSARRAMFWVCRVPSARYAGASPRGQPGP